jgi:uncharacterized coiled-coil protein SlyX
MIDTAATEALQDFIDLERRIALQREAVRKLTVLGWSDGAEKARAHLDLMLQSLSRLRQRAQANGVLEPEPTTAE